MNKLQGHIVKIETSGNLSRVIVALSDEIEVSAVVIETPDTASYLKEGNGVHVLFKETEVILSRDPKVSVSLENRIPGQVKDFQTGDLFCEVGILTPIGYINALISRAGWETWPMNLEDKVIAMVKTNEIMLQE